MSSLQLGLNLGDLFLQDIQFLHQQIDILLCHVLEDAATGNIWSVMPFMKPSAESIEVGMTTLG